MSNKRKLENATFEQKMSVIQHDLFSFSAFCTELHRVTNYHLDVCKLEKITCELDILVREQYDKEKFVGLCNACPEAFSTFYSCSFRKNYWIEYFLSKSK